MDRINPGGAPDDPPAAIPLVGPPIICVLLPHHDDTADLKPSVADCETRKQSVVDRSENRSSRDNNGCAKTSHQIQHEFVIIDRNEHAACTFNHDGLRIYRA